MTTAQDIIINARKNWELGRDGVTLVDAIEERFNAFNADVADDGSVWIETAGGSRWLREEELESLVAWLRDRKRIA